MRIAIGNDHTGVELKKRLLTSVLAPHDVTDLGVHATDSVDYPDQAHLVAERIAAGQADRGILICGTGIGMAMAADKHPGIRAARCDEPFSAELSRLHNDANVLCLGARMLGIEMAERIVEVWLATPFSGGRHTRRVEKIG
ncbi:ribose 5-phosphate isomerase B [Candidatus Bipolaricaulota bacterium]|nr:ribose 5-phosphate isomerase B [Candidatus Bipolaricaulota bacterium]